MPAFDRVKTHAIRALQEAHVYGLAKRVNDLVAPRLPREKARHSRMLALYAAFVQPGELVFDIGANLGNRTSVFLELGARVVAVDPQSVCIARLRSRFAGEPRVTIVPMALGPIGGEADLLTSQAHGISSMSKDWVRSVQDSGRFASYRWDRMERVQVTTMDALIAAFGRPQFSKLDVEGFESQVLQGLSNAVAALSFECAPEYLPNAFACMDRLGELGRYEYNYNLNETMVFELPRWVSPKQMRQILETIDADTFADIYARLRDDPAAPNA